MRTMRFASVISTFLMLTVACAPAAPAAPTAAPKAAAPTQPAPAAKATQPVAAAKPAHSAEVERLLAAAKAANETDLNISWGGDDVGGADGAKRFETLFNQMYGTNVKFNFTPTTIGTNDVFSKIKQEAAAGQPAFTDVLFGAEIHYGDATAIPAFEAYDYTQLSPRVKPEMVAPANIAVEFNSRFPNIAYNTNLVKGDDIPKKLEDVLNPKFTGKIAATTAAAGLDTIAQRPDWGREKFRGFVVKLSHQAAGLIRSGELDRVASGEFAMLVVSTGSFQVKQLKAKGAPIDFVITPDMALLNFHMFGVPKMAQHKNLAKLYINMVLSEEGQKILYEGTFGDHDLMPNSRTTQEIAEMKAKGIEPLRLNAKFMAETPNMQTIKDDYTQILLTKPAQ